MKKDPTQVKQEQEELAQFFDGLLAETFTIDYQGRKFTFKKRFTSTVLTKISKLDPITQMNYLIAHLSLEPKLPVDIVKFKLPSDLLGLISAEIKSSNTDVLSGEEPRTSPPKNP